MTQQVDREVHALVRQALDAARTLVTEHHAAITRVAEQLLQKEVR